jgi:hypothetical protein
MSVGHAMKPMSEAYFAILRRHMVEVIGIQVDLASEELGKAALDEQQLIRDYEAGVPMADLLRIPPLPEGKTPWDMLSRY